VQATAGDPHEPTFRLKSAFSRPDMFTRIGWLVSDICWRPVRDFFKRLLQVDTSVGMQLCVGVKSEAGAVGC
jgi:hypothetical protein